VILQLNPPLPMTTPRGNGLAHFVIDYGVESDLMWVVFLDADGACWTVPNPDIRLEQNWTMGRRFDKPAAARAASEPRVVPKLRPAEGE
jgi:hypothetical protein